MLIIAMSRNCNPITSEPTEFGDIRKYVYDTETREPVIPATRADWIEAERNTFNNTVVFDMSKKLGLLGEGTFFVVTTAYWNLGAAAILNKRKIRKVIGAGEYYALPSSVHEFILVPQSSGAKEGYDRMVYSINRSTVDPEEWLADEAFEMEV